MSHVGMGLGHVHFSVPSIIFSNHFKGKLNGEFRGQADLTFEPQFHELLAQRGKMGRRHLFAPSLHRHIYKMEVKICVS